MTWRDLIKQLAARLPMREIRGLKGEPYLERYHLLALGPTHNPWLCIVLHRFLASDPDRGLHDHPWAWSASLVLSGEYLELVPGKINRRAAGSLGVFGPSHRHRVLLPATEKPIPPYCINCGNDIACTRGCLRTIEDKSIYIPGECWTLFAHGHRVRGWGFWRERCVDSPKPIGDRVYHYVAQALNANDNHHAGWWKQ